MSLLSPKCDTICEVGRISESYLLSSLTDSDTDSNTDSDTMDREVWIAAVPQQQNPSLNLPTFCVASPPRKM